MLRVDLRDLRKGPVRTDGLIPATDPLFAELGVSLAGPLTVSGSVEPTSQGDYLWHGRFGGRVNVACRRCLRDLLMEFEESVEALFTTNPELLEDPVVYPLPESGSGLDVAEAVREELALALASYPLCRDDCAGLCITCGNDLNQGPCGCRGPASR